MKGAINTLINRSLVLREPLGCCEKTVFCIGALFTSLDKACLESLAYLPEKHFLFIISAIACLHISSQQRVQALLLQSAYQLLCASVVGPLELLPRLVLPIHLLDPVVILLGEVGTVLPITHTVLCLDEGWA